MNAKPLNMLRAALREDKDLITDLGGSLIGIGCERKAYMVEVAGVRFVVKAVPNYVWCGNLPIRKAPTVTVGPWEIQKYYTPVDDSDTARQSWHRSDAYSQACSYGYDLHAGNIGLDSRGRFVAFDW